MKFTMRDKICKLIGKYNELEQQAMVNVAGGAFRTMLGKTPTKEEENASEKASIYHWMQEDLKQLLEEDEAPAGKWWCADSAAQAAESAANEVRNNG